MSFIDLFGDISISIIVGIFIALISVFLTYKGQSLLEYRKLLGDMIKEIEYNHERITIEAFLKYLNEFDEQFKNPRIWIGLPKDLDVWTRARPLLRYLPENAYLNFINKGWYWKVDKTTLYHISLFYLGCRDFSDKEQECEIHLSKNRSLSNCIKAKEKINTLFFIHMPRIEGSYTEIHIHELKKTIQGHEWTWLVKQFGLNLKEKFDEITLN